MNKKNRMKELTRGISKGGLLLLWLLSTVVSAQMIVTKPPEISSTELVFNRKFIKDNKVRTIRAAISNKKDNEVIVDNGLMKGYDFDTAGRLVRIYVTAIKTTTATEVPDIYYGKGGKRITYMRTNYTHTYDTLFTWFFYDSQGRLTIKRSCDGPICNAWYYEYAAGDKPVKETICRETNVSGKTNEFRLGVQTGISTERFEYIPLAKTQEKKNCYNDENRIYRTAMIQLDERGNTLSEEYEFAVTWVRQVYAYQYNGNNQLTVREYHSSAGGDIKEKETYEYEQDRVITQKKYRNDVYVLETSYLYDENKKFLRTQVSRDHLKKSIGIIKYECEFYE